MAHSKSSKKRVFIGERNASRNQAIKSRVKTFIKKVLSAVEAKNVDEAKAALQVVYKELDKAVDLCYRPQAFAGERSRIEFLFDLYEKYTANLFTPIKEKKKRAKK